MRLLTIYSIQNVSKCSEYARKKDKLNYGVYRTCAYSRGCDGEHNRNSTFSVSIIYQRCNDAITASDGALTSKLYLSRLSSGRPFDWTVRVSLHPQPINAQTGRHWKSPTSHNTPPQPPIPVRMRTKTNKMAQSEEPRSALPLAGAKTTAAHWCGDQSCLGKPAPRLSHT